MENGVGREPREIPGRAKLLLWRAMRQQGALPHHAMVQHQATPGERSPSLDIPAVRTLCWQQSVSCFSTFKHRLLEQVSLFGPTRAFLIFAPAEDQNLYHIRTQRADQAVGRKWVAGITGDLKEE